MIRDIRCIMVILIGSIEYNTDNREDEHDDHPMFLSIAHFRYHVHEEQGRQEPGDTVQFTGNVRI